MTDAEQTLWKRLRNRALGPKFRRQQPVGPYVADFFCSEYRLIIELDGGQHASALSDRARDRWLAEQGYRVLRFWANDTLRTTDAVLQAVYAALHATPHPRPLPQGEREKKEDNSNASFHRSADRVPKQTNQDSGVFE